MTINEIREKFAYLYESNCKSATYEFLCSIRDDYQYAITLTLKDKWYHEKDGVRRYHYSKNLDIPHIQYIFNRFEHQLNKLVWRQKYYRHRTEKLSFFKVWENGKGSKRLHFHGAIGNLPKGMQISELSALIDKASNQCCEIDNQHREDFCDFDWLNYITKEVERKNTDNILW